MSVHATSTTKYVLTTGNADVVYATVIRLQTVPRNSRLIPSTRVKTVAVQFPRLRVSIQTLS